MKTKEQIQKYNKEYFARPNVIARAKIRNAQPHIKARRKAYKKTETGRDAENRYRRSALVNNPKIRERHLARRYGITLEQYELMFKEQAGKCLICLMTHDKLHIDHCHTTGRVRGLLCGSCNRALGLLKDNTAFLLQAVKYLSR